MRPVQGSTGSIRAREAAMSKTNAVHKADVKVGSTYAVKVSGRIVPVTILEANKQLVGYPKRQVVMWVGENRQTGKHVSIRSAAKLRYELVQEFQREGPQLYRWVRKDSPIVFELIDARFPCEVGGRTQRDVTPDELAGLCGEDAPEQCQEFEDESGRWRRV
jgi:hypothetical protein